ncbi:hypothetical protein ACHAW5_009964 [Stephanodiscus triporus]|uniref:Splicing factor Cactin C-terminal domain-containing protein n=1 Tax=Stephanodiscus triporus TaxID=2934178 RepID=A0ABD3NXI5_9STRA
MSGGGSGGEGDTLDGVADCDYWTTVLDQLTVHMAKMELSEIHSRMLVRQLEKLEARREELRKKALSGGEEADVDGGKANGGVRQSRSRCGPDFGNPREELGLDDEIDLDAGRRGRGTTRVVAGQVPPRKPRYFNRVKTGYDWNIVQGYKFNVFYPDLIDRTRTPQYRLEKADADDPAY